MNAQMQLFNIDYEKEAIDFLKANEPENGYLLCYSGGKDSDVLLHLAKQSGVKFYAVYSATGLDPKEVVQHIKKHKEINFLYPKKSFWELVKKYGLPIRSNRWCCTELKHGLTKNIEKTLCNKIVGVRAEESASRANRQKIDIIGKRKPKQTLKPVFDWKEWQVWEYIEKHNIDYCSLYNDGYSRLGCIICPFICSKNQSQINKNRKKYPKHFEIFEKCAKEYYDKKQIIDCSYEEFLRRWYHGENLMQNNETKQLELF